MIEIILTSLIFSLVPVAISLIIDVCLGYPSKDEFDNKAIFFSLSYYFAKKRLIKLGLFKDLVTPYQDVYKNAKGGSVVQWVTLDGIKNVTFQEGRKYFSWEKGFGMCPVCTNIRIAIIFSLLCIFLNDNSYFFLLLIPIFSNLYLLIYNKLK